jgi:hypothetical protein
MTSALRLNLLKTIYRTVLLDKATRAHDKLRSLLWDNEHANCEAYQYPQKSTVQDHCTIVIGDSPVLAGVVGRERRR